MDHNKEFGVASYFVNVGQGDCIIILLYLAYERNPLLGNDGKQGAVHRAILMDGGQQVGDTANHRYHENIDKTIEEIEAKFDCQSDRLNNHQQKQLLFDGFVCTHWDADHARGVMWFLLQDMKDNKNGGKLSRARYFKDQMGTVQPRSFFYAPTWKTNKGHLPVPNIEKPWDDAYDDFFSTPQDRTVLWTLTRSATMSISPLFTYKDLLIMRVGVPFLIGRNLFSRDEPGDPQDPAAWKKLISSRSMAELIAQVEPSYDDIKEAKGRVPALYCVAVNRFVMGFDEMVLDVTQKNASSICTLVVWVNPDDHTDFAVSHYMAGDAHDKLEEKIQTWLDYTPADEKQVTIVKLSHHGAVTSNPKTMWQMLKPQFVVGSSGGKNAFGHPRECSIPATKRASITPLSTKY